MNRIWTIILFAYFQKNPKNISEYVWASWQPTTACRSQSFTSWFIPPLSEDKVLSMSRYKGPGRTTLTAGCPVFGIVGLDCHQVWDLAQWRLMKILWTNIPSHFEKLHSHCIFVLNRTTLFARLTRIIYATGLSVYKAVSSCWTMVESCLGLHLHFM